MNIKNGIRSFILGVMGGALLIPAYVGAVTIDLAESELNGQTLDADNSGDGVLDFELTFLTKDCPLNPGCLGRQVNLDVNIGSNDGDVITLNAIFNNQVSPAVDWPGLRLTLQRGPVFVQGEGTSSPSSTVNYVSNDTRAFVNFDSIILSGSSASISDWKIDLQGLGDGDDFRLQIQPVPLPAAAWLLVSGLGVLGIASRRRKAS